MPDNPVDDLSDEQLESLPEGLRAEVRKNRQYRQEAEANAAAAEAAKREAAFARAGIPDTPLHNQLAQGYSGENEPEAIKAYFQGLGVELEAPAGGASDEELAEQRRLAELGGSSDPGGDVRFEDAIGSAKNPEELMALIASAPEGATTYIEGRQRRIGVPTIE